MNDYLTLRYCSIQFSIHRDFIVVVLYIVLGNNNHQYSLTKKLYYLQPYVTLPVPNYLKKYYSFLKTNS